MAVSSQPLRDFDLSLEVAKVLLTAAHKTFLGVF
jgi:hypothetical protein